MITHALETQQVVYVALHHDTTSKYQQDDQDKLIDNTHFDV